MAVTKIWPISGTAADPIRYIENKEKTANPEVMSKADLDAVLNYATNGMKTEHKYFVTALNCNTTCAAQQFNIVKKRFDKRSGRVAYHAYQSFAKGESTPEEAHQIGVELAKRLWGDRFQVVIATHLNTECLHNHFVINSVSFRDGKMLRSTQETLHQMIEASDELCREHGLSVIEKPKGRGRSHHELMMEKAGMPTRLNVARQAIDEAIAVSVNIPEFEAELKKRGFLYMPSSCTDLHPVWGCILLLWR